MKEFKKGILDNDVVISAENVQKMGEIIALCAVKTIIVRGGKDLHNLYKGLLHDENRSESDMSIVIREIDFREGKLAPDVRFSEAYTDALTGERYCSSGGTLRFILSSLSAIILIK